MAQTVRGEPGAKPFVDDLLLGPVSYVAEKLPRYHLLKVNPPHKSLQNKKEKKKKNGTDGTLLTVGTY